MAKTWNTFRKLLERKYNYEQSSTWNMDVGIENIILLLKKLYKSYLENKLASCLINWSTYFIHSIH